MKSKIDNRKSSMKPKLYRGLTKEGNLVYGWYIRTRHPETHWIIKDGLYVTDILIGINPKLPKHLQGCYKVIPETVGQSTGLKDKNGKMGWHHDLFIHDTRNEGKEIEIIWENGSWRGRCVSSEGIGERDFAFVVNDREMAQAKIIGSIHEKKGLLKQ